MPARPNKGTVRVRAKFFGVLLTFRRQDSLPETLRAILTQTRRLDQLLIVDNENSHQTKAIVDQCRNEHPTVEILYIATPENLGSAGGWAFGMRQILEITNGDDWIMPLDDDNPPQDPHDFERMFEFALATRDRFEDLAAVGIIGARLNRRGGRISRVPDEELSGRVPVDWVGTGSLPLYRVSALRQVGLFDGGQFFGHTEMELGLRFRHAGFRIFAHGDMWKERRQKSGHLGITRRPSRICQVSWKRYYSIRNYVHIMKHQGRWDVVIKQILIQCLAKPLWTAFAKPSKAIPGLRLALRASFDGILGRMGRRVEPDEMG